MGLAVGTRPAGLAHRVLGDGGAAAGPAFEIHGGGLDLVFPHHENELAQSSALGYGFAQIWMHNGMLRFTGEKMSKSVGNVATIQEALDEWGRETLLVFFLTAHWRSPIDYSEETMARGGSAGRRLPRGLPQSIAAGARRCVGARSRRRSTTTSTPPRALALMHEWRDHELLRRALDVFGLASLADALEAPAELHELARRRQAARAARDFAESDRLRAEIEAAGWEARDEADGYRLVRRS